jgi:O-antigen chain-terminating methyltransferase
MLEFLRYLAVGKSELGCEIFMDTLEINSDEVNVEEIMKKIRDNIQKKGIEVYPKEFGEPQNNILIKEFYNRDSIKNNLEYINSNWDIQNNSYLISSHRPAVGKVLIKGRELVHGEVRRYVSPIVQKQTVFNENVVSIFNNLASNINSLDNKIEQIMPNIELKIRQQKSDTNNKTEQLNIDTDNKIEQLKLDADKKIEQLKTDMDNRIRTQIDTFISSINSDIEKKSWLSNLLDKKIDSQLKNHKILEDKKLEPSEDKNSKLNYFVFEERFRGSRDEIKQRQLKYLDYFKGCKNVLDIGCGRGEFLELMKENGINAQGLEIDVNMANFCKSKELKVNVMDAISFLEQVDDNSLDGIFIDQVVEHLEPDYLVRMLKLCYQKLMYGYFVIIETVNPLSLVSFVNFYIDLSHVKPLHPETMRFLLEVAGFRDIELKFYSPVKDEIRLQKIQFHKEMEEREKLFIETFNRNIDILNNQLYGPQDYAFFGKK